MRAASVRRRARLEASSPAGQRRVRRDPRARRRHGRARRSARGRDDRDGSLRRRRRSSESRPRSARYARSGSAFPATPASGSPCSIGQSRTPSPVSARRAADAPRPLPREHRRRTVRRHHGGRRRRGARDPAIRTAATTCTAERCEVLRLRGTARFRTLPACGSSRSARPTLRSRQLFGDFLLSDDAAVADATVPPRARRARASTTGRRLRRSSSPRVGSPRGVAGARAHVPHATPGCGRSAPGAPRFWEIDELVDRDGARARSSSRSARRRSASTHPSKSFGGGARGERRGHAAAARRRRGRRAAARVHDPRGARHAARPRGRAATAHLVRARSAGSSGCSSGLESARRRVRRRRRSAGSAGIAVAGVVARLAGAPAGAVLRESVLSPRGLGLAAAAAVVVAAACSSWITVSLPARSGGRVRTLDLVARHAAAGRRRRAPRRRRRRGAARARRGHGAAAPASPRPHRDRGGARRRAGSSVARARSSQTAVAAGSRRAWQRSGLHAGRARPSRRSPSSRSRSRSRCSPRAIARRWSRGDREQAAFQVPHDVVVREDLRNLVRVFDAAPLERFDELAGTGRAARTRPARARQRGTSRAVSGVTVLGLDRDAIEERRRLAGRLGGRSRTRPSSRALVEPDAAMEMRGLPLPGRPDRARRRPRPRLARRDRALGRRVVPARRARRGAPARRRPRLARTRSDRLDCSTALEIVPPPRLIERGADAGSRASSRTFVSPGRSRCSFRDWIGGRRVGRSADAEWRRRPRSADLAAHAPGCARLSRPTTSPPAVLVTPAPGRARRRRRRGASAAGRRRRGAGPGRGSRRAVPGDGATLVVVGDRTALRTAVNAAAPGAARENEVWLDVSPERARRRGRGADTAAVSRPRRRRRRTDVEAEARRDPLAHGTLLALVGTAARRTPARCARLALAVRSDLRDDSGEHFDSRPGRSPASSGASSASRAATVSAVGLVGGIVTGLALLLLVTRVVTVTAAAATPSRRSPSSSIRCSSSPGSPSSSSWPSLLVGGATRHAFAGARGPAYRETELMAPLVDARELFAVYPSRGRRRRRAPGPHACGVDDAEICVVLGPSGSGKTTFMRVLAGLARPSAGSLVVAGVDVVHASARELGGTAATCSATPTSTTGARSRAS